MSETMPQTKLLTVNFWTISFQMYVKYKAFISREKGLALCKLNNRSYEMTVNIRVWQMVLICFEHFLTCFQCDQIWRFIGLWTTFQSLCQQLFCQNLPHSQAVFVKVSKSLIFLVKSFLGNFYRHLVTFYWSHCPFPVTKWCKNKPFYILLWPCLL